MFSQPRIQRPTGWFALTPHLEYLRPPTTIYRHQCFLPLIVLFQRKTLRVPGRTSLIRPSYWLPLTYRTHDGHGDAARGCQPELVPVKDDHDRRPV